MDAGPANSTEVRWLTREDVEDRSAATGGLEPEDHVAAMFGGVPSVGGVVSDTVGNTQEVTGIDIGPYFITICNVTLSQY